ncbi:MAG: hypothetical protein MJA83_08615, partial [Gammaproteobacteria bacterium]|nr:hypothetical protein [Gammaproteobacteria bacterium]
RRGRRGGRKRRRNEQTEESAAANATAREKRPSQTNNASGSTKRNKAVAQKPAEIVPEKADLPATATPVYKEPVAQPVPDIQTTPTSVNPMPTDFTLSGREQGQGEGDRPSLPPQATNDETTTVPNPELTVPNPELEKKFPQPQNEPQQSGKEEASQESDRKTEPKTSKETVTPE